MNEFWIVYDIATGTERWRGSGALGAAAQQQIPEGLDVVVVPQAVIAGAELDLLALREAVAASVDSAAERMRQRFLTPGAGQAMTYTRKEAEARAWTADQGAVTPFLSAEAAARKMDLAGVVAEVIAMADAWVAIGSAIEALRMGAKAAIGAADTLGAIVAAGTVDWSAIHA